MAGSKGTRMAGEKLSKSEQNKLTREKIGNDPERLAERISIVDRDKYDVSGYTDKEINMALQGGTFNMEDYNRLTGGKPKDNDPKPEDPGTGGTDDNPAMPVASGGGGNLSPSLAVSNANPITNNVSGRGNKVTNNQDNSVTQITQDNTDNSRYYGGSNRYFSYGTGNPVQPESNPYDVDPASPVISNENTDNFLSDFMKKTFVDAYDPMKYA